MYLDTIMTPPVVVWVHALVTVMLAGLIWTIQVVHYPLFAKVGDVDWVAYERSHQTRITVVVAPLMLTELVTAALLLLPLLSATTGRVDWLPLAGAVLVAVIWTSTVFVQVPLHGRLEQRFDPAAIARLVSTNWIRTIAWTLRALIALELLHRAV